MNDQTKKIGITTDFIRLDQFLKLAGLCVTGGAAKGAVQSGLVSVNGEVCPMRGKKLRAGDAVSFRGVTAEVIRG